jgi:hypothetical protein
MMPTIAVTIHRGRPKVGSASLATDVCAKLAPQYWTVSFAVGSYVAERPVSNGSRVGSFSADAKTPITLLEHCEHVGTVELGTAIPSGRA